MNNIKDKLIIFIIFCLVYGISGIMLKEFFSSMSFNFKMEEFIK